MLRLLQNWIENQEFYNIPLSIHKNYETFLDINNINVSGTGTYEVRIFHFVV